MFEAHPVPQNVTEFQFHLVGDMTIKQFIYLASGLGSAYLVFALFANPYPIVAYPLILILSASGGALAFLPIQDRPLDHWLGAYFKAIFQPTKRSYKSKLLTKEDPLFKSRLQVFLNTRRRAAGPIFKDAKTKSTPFSFNVQSMVQNAPPPPQIIATPPVTSQPVQPQPAPVSPPAPVPSPPQITVPQAPIQLTAPSITIVAPQTVPPPMQTQLPVPPAKPVEPPPIAKPAEVQTQVLGTAGLSPIDVPEKVVPPVATPVPASAPVPAAITNPIVIKPQALYVTNTPIQAVAPPPASSAPKAPVGVSNVSHEPEVPSEADLSHTIELAKQVHQVQQKILKTNEQIESIRSQAAAQDANPKQYLDQFHTLLGELQNLNQQAANLSSQVAELTNEPMRLPSLQADLVVKPKSIPTITLTSIANVINGIVTDSNGNYLDGSIILAHDKSGIPVRALKTNKLGQFVAATPLNNGIYTITIEKDELVFDTIELELKGEVLKPILITSKPVAGGVAHG